MSTFDNFGVSPVGGGTASRSLETISSQTKNEGTGSASGLEQMEMQALGASIPKPPILALEEQISQLGILLRSQPISGIKSKLSEIRGHLEKTVVSLHEDGELKEIFLSNGNLKFGMTQSLEGLGTQIAKLSDDPQSEDLKPLEGHVKKLSSLSKTLKSEVQKGQDQAYLGKTAPEVLQRYDVQRSANTRGGRAFTAIKKAGNAVLSGIKEWFAPGLKNKGLAAIRVPVLALTGFLALLIPLAAAAGGLVAGVLATILTGGVAFHLIPALTIAGFFGGAFLAWGIHSGLSVVLGLG